MEAPGWGPDHVGEVFSVTLRLDFLGRVSPVELGTKHGLR